MKRFFCLLIICCFMLCSCQEAEVDGGISVVTSNFPAFDFVRQIAGDNVNIKLLIKPGGDLHSYEPSPADIIDISECDIFIYNGGENDQWAEEILENAGDVKTVRMMDCVDEIFGEHESDEHVWTSPLNAAKISERICEELCAIDGDKREEYRENTSGFTKTLLKLDGEIEEIVNSSKRDILVFADRFPVRYFTERYSLRFASPFAGCSHDTEASPKDIADIIDMVNSENIPVVFYGETSDRKLAKTVASETGVEMRLFHSCHNLSREDFEAGRTYLDIMNDNKEVLKEALGL